MSEKDLKLTDLDYATGDHHLDGAMEFFRENDDGMILFPLNPSVFAVRPYANKAEQDTIDMISRFLASRRDVRFRSPEQLFSILPRICRHGGHAEPQEDLPMNNMIRKILKSDPRPITWM